MVSGSLALSAEELLAAASAKAEDPARCGYELCRSVVLAVREARLHRPDLVSKFGVYLLQSHAHRLGSEVWAMYEQVYIALLQHGRSSPESKALAEQYLGRLCAAPFIAYDPSRCSPL
eukprot:6178108-Pleurochrysis_carterae.AAC.2